MQKTHKILVTGHTKVGLAGLTHTLKPRLLTGALPATPSYLYHKARIFSYADMLHVKAIYKTTTITACKTEYRENICLKTTRTDVRLLKYGE